MNFRMPSDLKAKLESAAKSSGRSVTAEITGRLETSFKGTSRIGDLGLEDLLNALAGIDEINRAIRRLHEDESLRDRMRKAGAYNAGARLLDVSRRLKAAIWAEQFDASEDLQREFVTRESYAAYMVHAEPDALGADWQRDRVADQLAEHRPADKSSDQ